MKAHKIFLLYTPGVNVACECKKNTLNKQF